MDLHIETFRADCTDKEAAVKVLEEASEAREAWQVLTRGAVLDSMTHQPPITEHRRMRLADELADCITACANLADRYGIDLQDALDRVERHNRERGRYE